MPSRTGISTDEPALEARLDRPIKALIRFGLHRAQGRPRRTTVTAMRSLNALISRNQHLNSRRLALGPNRMPIDIGSANKTARLKRIRAAKATLEAEAKKPPPDDDGPGPSSGMMKSGKPNRGPDGGPPDRAHAISPILTAASSRSDLVR
jgi:hypothetical protein